MKYQLTAAFFFVCFIATAQKTSQKEQVIDKWTKAVLNVLCYSKAQRESLLLFDSALTIGRVDSNSYRFYVNQLIASGSRGTAIWLTYQKHNFLITARHVLEDLSIGRGSCYSEIHLIENDTIHSIDLTKAEPRPHRTFVVEVGTPSDIINVNNIKLYKFSSIDDDVAVVNMDSSYYFYGLLKFLNLKGYKPVEIEDIDTLFRVKNKEPVIALGFPDESITKTKNQKELPINFALATSPIFTIPIITIGTVSDVGKGTDSFEIGIFTYHGFSGGPIINKKGKLIGITHGAALPEKKAARGSYYEFHELFKKSTLITPLLRELLIQIQSQEMQSEHF